MKKTYLIAVSFLLVSLFTNAQNIVGQWYGVLKVQATQLRLVFNISKNETGYSATMDSPDQGAKGIPVTSISFENAVLKISIPKAKIEYEGTLNNEQQIIGNFKQGGYTMLLNLGREEIKKEKPKRPQEPKEPFNYYIEEVEFENTNANISLAGTLTMPGKEGNYPAVILITGSGPQNRDEALLGHKPFWVLADYLTKQGIAVLRFDDRGTAASKGSFATATTADFATDVEAAVKYLQTRKEINQKKIGLMGHSEGGTIAPIIAARNKDINFIVMLAGTGIRGDELLLLQEALIAKASGSSDADIKKSQTINRAAFEIVLKSTSIETLKKDLQRYFKEVINNIPTSEKPKDMNEEDFIDLQVKQLATPWMQYFIKYNPAAALEKVKCAVLTINGEKDLQVPAKENLTAIEKALIKAGNRKYTIKTFPNLNHLFQECKTGSPDEYAAIEQTFSPTALDAIGKWIVETTKN